MNTLCYEIQTGDTFSKIYRVDRVRYHEPVVLPVLPGDDLLPSVRQSSDYRKAAEHFTKVICGIDRLMIGSNNIARTWLAMSISLGLPSTIEQGITQAHIARCHNVSKMAISKEVHRICTALNIQPALGTGRKPNYRNLT